MMRDVLAYKFMRDAGISAPRTAYVKLYLNNTYWGLYIMVEEIDKNFIEKELGITPTTYLKQSSGVKRTPSNSVTEWQDELAEIFKVAKTLNKDDRLMRTKEKFARNREFANH
jgi:spore coat protein CotH